MSRYDAIERRRHRHPHRRCATGGSTGVRLHLPSCLSQSVSQPVSKQPARPSVSPTTMPRPMVAVCSAGVCARAASQRNMKQPGGRCAIKRRADHGWSTRWPFRTAGASSEESALHAVAQRPVGGCGVGGRGRQSPSNCACEHSKSRRGPSSDAAGSPSAGSSGLGGV